MFKKIVLAMLLSGVFGNSMAERDYYTCDVERVGPGVEGKYFVSLICPTTNTPTWHTIKPAMKDAMLATLLTAVSLEKQVEVNIDPEIPYSKIKEVYLRASD